MKVIIVLCSVLCVASCIGADEDGSRSSTEAKEETGFTPSMCPTADSRVYEKVFKVGNNCVTTAAAQETSSQLRNYRTIEEFRDFFRSFCQNQSLVRSCLAETTVNVEICQNQTFLNMFKMYRDAIETTLNIGCDEDGEKLAGLWYELIDFVRTNNKNTEDAKKCSERFSLMLNDLDRSEIDVSSKFYNLHKEFVIFAECTYRLELNQSFKDILKHFMDVIINTMKCVHPQDGSLVPCVTIDASLISTTNVCDLKTIGTEMSLYDVLEENSGICFVFLRYPDEDVDNNDKIRDIVSTECKYRTPLPFCYNTSRIVSEICLNDTQQKEFELLGDFIKSASEDSCFEDGRRLSEIMFEVYRLERTGHGHAVWDCVDVVMSTRNVTDEHRSCSMNMRFYHEVEVFKGCLVNKLQGDQTSVDAATSLIDGLLKKVKCVHPEEGTTVTCETLHNRT